MKVAGSCIVVDNNGGGGVGGVTIINGTFGIEKKIIQHFRLNWKIQFFFYFFINSIISCLPNILKIGSSIRNGLLVGVKEHIVKSKKKKKKKKKAEITLTYICRFDVQGMQR